MNISRIILILLSAWALSACGFHLRGSGIDLTKLQSRVKIIGAERGLQNRISDALKKYGAQTTTEKSTFIMNIKNSEFKQELLSTDSAGRATAYNLIYRLQYEFITAKQSRAQEIIIKRALQYNQARQLQFENEKKFIHEQMQSDAVRLIIKRLSQL